MRNALRLKGHKNLKTLLGVAGFRYQLSPKQTKKTPLPIPAVDFTEATLSLKKTFNQTVNIYVTLDTFVTKFREIFHQTKLTHNSAAESKRWLGSPDIGHNSTLLFSV